MQEEQIPFPEGSVDVVLSNQVVEHVEDKKRHFHEMWRVLKPGGFALLVIPVKETLMEGHVKLPLFHWVNLNSPIVRACYRFLVWIRLGAYPARAKRMEWRDKTFEDYSRHHFFISRRHAIELLKECGFTVRTLDREYPDALQIKYGRIIFVLRSMMLGRFLLSQVGVAIEARKL